MPTSPYQAIDAIAQAIQYAVAKITRASSGLGNKRLEKGAVFAEEACIFGFLIQRGERRSVWQSLRVAKARERVLEIRDQSRGAAALLDLCFLDLPVKFVNFHQRRRAIQFC
jgi:hypothetical protein